MINNSDFDSPKLKSLNWAIIQKVLWLITYKETKNNITQRSFNYFIEAEGFYPHASELCYTLPPRKYPIPDEYCVKTSWGCEENQRTVQCEIKYIWTWN